MNYEQKHKLLGEYFFFCKRSTTLLRTFMQQTREAMQFRSKDRVIGAPKMKSGCPISEEVKFSVRFCGRSRLALSAQRARRGHQKRFLVLNLRELYEEWEKTCFWVCAFSWVTVLRPAGMVAHTQFAWAQSAKLQPCASCRRLQASYSRTAAVASCVQHRQRKRSVQLLPDVSQQRCPSEHFGERSRCGQSLGFPRWNLDHGCFLHTGGNSSKFFQSSCKR